jgi:exopolysaccharide production protein ExoZ
MFFYLCVALLMATGRETWPAIVMIFAALTMAGQVPGVNGALGNYAFFIDPLLMEFVFGVLVAGLFVNGRVGKPELIATACAVATLLITDPGNRAIVFGLPSAILVGAAAYISRLRPTPSFVEASLERLGDASYSIYLAQVNTVSFACLYAAALVPGIPPLALVLAATVTGVLAGLLLNIFVEWPLLRLCWSFAAPRVRDVKA